MIIFYSDNRLYISGFIKHLEKSLKKILQVACRFGEKLYLCTRFPKGTPPDEVRKSLEDSKFFERFWIDNVVRKGRKKRRQFSFEEDGNLDRD